MTAHLALASQAGWFEGREVLSSLALRLKTLLVIEEELVVSPGAFLARVRNGELSEQHFAEKSAPWAPNRPSNLGFFESDVAIELRMDWHPLLAAAGVNGSRGVRFAENRLSPQGKRGLKERAEVLLLDPRLVSSLPGSPGVRAAIVKHWLVDAANAALEGASFSVDLRASGFVDVLHRVIDATIPEPAPCDVVLRLHDLSTWQWDGVVRFRDSTSGKKVTEIFKRARPGLPENDVVLLQHEVDALTGRDEKGRGIDVRITQSRVPSLLGTQLVDAVPCVYAIGPSMPQ